jgi:hypothetical protein
MRLVTSMNLEAIELDKCYLTKTRLVRLVTKIEGDDVTFASRARGHFVGWHNTAARNLMSRQKFAREAFEEVPYYWEGGNTASLRK